MTDSVMHFNASAFKDFDTFEDHVKQVIRTSRLGLDVIYKEVGQDWATGIFDLLEPAFENRKVRKHYNSQAKVFRMKVMPTHIHDCHQEWHIWAASDWRVSGLLTADEFYFLRPRVGTTINFCYAPYAGSRKEPDLCVFPDTHHLPSIVMESGWSESIGELRNDTNLWLVGGAGTVKVVFVLDWRRHLNSDKVSGTIEVWGLDSNLIPVCRQTEIIFPRPQNSQNQVINITRRQLFSGQCFPNRNPNDVFSYQIDKLRDAASIALTYMNLQPA